MEAVKALDLDKEQQAVEPLYTLELQSLSAQRLMTVTTLLAHQSEKGCPESSEQCNLLPKD